MGRISVVIKDSIEKRFRKRFVNKKGDISKEIEELILIKLKGGLKKNE